jgi:hypothetical protein
VVYSEILLSPGSAEQISFTVKDRNKQPIDFTVGYWAARLLIVRYPGSLSGAFHSTATANQTGTDSQWLTLDTVKNDAGVATASLLVLTPDPAVTEEWAFTRYHYDCYLIGPTITTKPIRLVHGPFIMDL